MTAYSLHELVAEKTRALYERTRPRDLYDVVYILENQPSVFDLTRLRELFHQKCEVKPLTVPSADHLIEAVTGNEELRSEWENMLAHQLPALPSLDDLLARLPELIRWIDEPAVALPAITVSARPVAPGETVYAPAGIQYSGTGRPLEAIRFSGMNRLLLEFDYHGKRRRVEPYSLRTAGTGNLLFYGWELADGHIKAYKVAEMLNIRPTTTSFRPRYVIEFTPNLFLTAPPTARPPRASSSASRPVHRGKKTGPVYIFECPYCAKKFRHTSNNPRLGKHESKDGYFNCKQLEARPRATSVVRAGTEKETGRLLAKSELAREQLAHLIRTDAPQGQIRSIATVAYELTATRDKTIAARKATGKERLPAVVFTTEECRQLKEYRASHNIALKEEHAGARVEAARVLAGAELTDAQGKADAFQTTRHLWKFEIEGWDRKLSLKEVEQEIKSKREERLRLYNFLRPGRRESIQGQIDYLDVVKKDLQKQLLNKYSAVQRTLGAAALRYDVASKEAEKAQQARSREGREMPLPVFQKDELGKMGEIATRNKHARLLALVYSQIREKVLKEPTPDALSRVKGHAVMARMEMLREAERRKAAIEYGEFRQVALRDSQGLDYTRSLREVEPRSALEAFIRHFTDSEEQKKERSEIKDIGREQLRRAEARSLKARDCSVVLDNIAADHFKAAGVRPGQVAPELNEKQIAELREFADKQPFLSGARKEFMEAARQAERALQEREAAEITRETQQFRNRDPHTRGKEQSSSPTTSDHRTDRDGFSRSR